MAAVFSGEIDFNNDLRFGDNFAVLYERYVRDGVHVTFGDVLAAEFENDGRQLYGFRFQIPGEAPAYFDFEGRSMKRQILASPLPFEPRVTSRFSSRRMHPVLGVGRPHQGVDYGAPTGTRVIAVANGTSRVRPRQAAARAIWCVCVTPTATRPITCTCRGSPRGCAPAPGSRRARRSATSGRPGSPPVRISTLA